MNRSSSPIEAHPVGTAAAFSSLAVVLNALRLRRFQAQRTAPAPGPVPAASTATPSQVAA